ncbi:MAG: pyrroline-5-carboxylate reductase [Infirmifilum sp.]
MLESLKNLKALTGFVLDADSIAVLGAGKIGSIIIRALSEKLDGVKVIATGRSYETLQNAAKLGAIAIRENRKAVLESDLIIISVKPFHFPQLLKETGFDVWVDKTVVSVMAGVTLSTLQKALEGAEVYRAMPNLNAYVGRSATAIAENGSGYRKNTVDALFKTLGTTYWVPEEYLDVWTGLAGSGPAFIAEIIDALAMGAVASGLNRELAYKAVLDVLEGTALLLRARSNIHPAQLRDEVATPSGTTIRGLTVLESRGVKAALMELVEQASRRSREIGTEVNERVVKELTFMLQQVEKNK